LRHFNSGEASGDKLGDFLLAVGDRVGDFLNILSGDFVVVGGDFLLGTLLGV